jgi:prepilin-type processing-associated H-X9-DG protein
MPMHRARRAFTLLEAVISVALIAVLLAILLPALFSARAAGFRERCADNQRSLGRAWQAYLGDHDGQFPVGLTRLGWHYGGARFSAVDGAPFLDPARPINRHLRGDAVGADVFHCPADNGIAHEHAEAGTGSRTAFRAFGTSYRANGQLLDARRCGLDTAHRGVRRREVTTAPSRMLVMGDAVWYEVAEQTGRSAAWHGEDRAGNMLFLDGSVRFVTIRPRDRAGPVVFDPVMRPAGQIRKQKSEHRNEN